MFTIISITNPNYYYDAEFFTPLLEISMRALLHVRTLTSILYP